MNKNRTIKKAYNKTITASLCVTLAAGMICPGNLVYGAEEAQKDENIYVNLNQDGSVADVYVVNEYILEKDTELLDYGNYSSVKNLSSNEEIVAEDGTIRINAQEGKFFYQGKLEDAVLPWNIHISYTLDGEVMEASELAGKIGKLKIYVTIRENPKGEENFFDNYLMQATVTLDTEKCGNIEAEGATEANVGKDRQLLYNIMAGQEKEFTISADVKDFEMAAITFQAVPMAFDIDSDSLDLDSMTEKIDEIKEAATDFDDGAKELDEGVGELLDGTKELKSGSLELTNGAGKLQSGTGSLMDGTKELKSGTSSLYNGALAAASGSNELKTGMETLESGLSDVLTGAEAIQQGLYSLTENSKDLTSGSENVLTALQTISKSLSGITVGAEQMQTMLEASTQILAGMESLTTGAQVVTDGLNAISKNYEAIAGLEAKNTESAAFLRSAAGMAGALYETAMQNEKAAAMIENLAGGMDISASLATLNNIATLLEQNNTTFESLESGINKAADGAAAVSGGMTELKEQYQLFDTEIQKLPVVLENMITSNVELLKNGIDTLVKEYKTLNTGIKDYTDGVSTIRDGYEELYQALLLVQSGTGELSSGASALASGNSALVSGAGDLLSGANAVVEGTARLYDGSGELYNGSNELYDGTCELYDGVSELKDGTEELVEGTEEFVSETEDIDEKIEEEIEKVIEEIAGGDYEAISFVSEENTMVNLVQFVMSTDPISIPKEEAVETEEEKTDFVTMLRALFEK